MKEVIFIDGLKKTKDEFFFVDSLQEKKIRSFFEMNDFKAGLKEELNRLNEFFCVIKNTKKYLFLAVDRIKTRPLFYYIDENYIYISRVANDILRVMKAKEINEISLKEFLATGYVLNDRTIYKDIKQIQAGEYFYYNKENNKIIIEKYFNYCYQKECLEETVSLSKLDLVYDMAIEKLVKIANGRQLVIPLSSGLDSRNIIVKLKKMNYSNIICYTYGKIKNDEAEISKNIAKKLSVKWYFIEYTKEDFELLRNDDEFQKYLLQAGNLTNTPIIQDYLAVKTLKEKKIVSFDSIFIPGYTGDFIAGSHIPSSLIEDQFVSKNIVEMEFVKKHFYLSKEESILQVKKYVNKNILQDYDEKMNSLQAINLLEKFDFENRQAKFINSALRIYEFFGFDYYTPLWDSRLIDFWLQVNPKIKINRNLYIDYDNLYISSYLDMNVKKVNIKRNKNLRFRSYKLNLNYKVIKLKKILNKNYMRDMYENHFLNWYYLFDYNYFEKNFNSIDIYSLLSKYYIEKLLEEN